MKDPSRTNAELTEEIFVLRQEIKALKQSMRRQDREETMPESEQQYRILFDHANEAIFVAQDGKLVFFNPMTSQTVGYSAEELMGRPFIEFIHADDRTLVAENYLKRLKGEDFLSRYAFRCIFKDGSIRWLEIDAVRIDWAGRPATLNFATDITERIQLQEALRQSKELYASLVDTVPDLIVRTDLDGKILFVNDYALQVSGYSRAEIEGHKGTLYDEDEVDACLRLFREKGFRLEGPQFQLSLASG